ncbi:MAG: ATP-binding cassette domain-containing protein, partial [Anaerococcus sp.]|nr:ATP-binding cassette domain-containing protein [Anaerococcus sp.]
MLEFKDFGLDYEDVDKKSYKILENVNINFEKGSVNVITGESGSGKSSIIKAINGIIPEIDKAKLSGKIKLDGKNIVDMTIADRSKFIATVFQNPKNQFYAVNSLDEIAFALENRNIERDEIFQTID